MTTPFDLGPALLFCPADRPERFAKAAERSDAVILDLEDAVSPDAKAAARQNLVRSELDPVRTIVRVNAVSDGSGADELALDLAAIAQTEYRTVMLAKAVEIPETLESYDVVALCESAAGILAAPAIAAHPSVVALFWGSEDLIVSLGGTSSRFRDGHFRAVALHSRSAVLLAAAAHGKAAIDSVHVDIQDSGGLAAEARDAVASGFVAKACIHPSQVEVVRQAYAPTADEVEFASAVIAAADGQHGAFQFQGRMIDEPVLVHARRVLARTESAE